MKKLAFRFICGIFSLFLLTTAFTPMFVNAAVCAPAPTSGTVINVRNTGATGNGSTNDTAAIQAAVNQVPAGGTVLVPSGTYMVNAITSVNLKSNMTFSMEAGAILKAIPNSAQSYEIIDINGDSNVIVIGGTVQGERAQHSGTTGEWGNGINIINSSNIVIDGVTVKDAWGDGFYAGGTSSNITFCGVTADNNRRQGLSITGGSGYLVKNSIFKNTKGTAPADGIDIEPNGGGPTVSNVEVYNNHLTGNEASGVQVTAYFQSVSNVKIHHNTISGNQAKYFVSGALEVQGVDGLSVANNLITGNSEDGIVFTNTKRGVGTANVTVNCNKVSGSSGWGIRLLSQSHNNTVTNNTLSSNTAGSILNQGSANSISNNPPLASTNCGTVGSDLAGDATPLPAGPRVELTITPACFANAELNAFALAENLASDVRQATLSLLDLLKKNLASVIFFWQK